MAMLYQAMRYSIIKAAAMVVLIISTGAAPASYAAQPIRFDSAKHLARFHLKPDQLYAEGRRSLLRHGWKPVRLGGDREHVFRTVPPSWFEFADCSGTGWGFCNSLWRQGEKCLQVTSYGDHEAKNAAKVRRVVAAETGKCKTMLRDYQQ
jgi:hypothetical protein